MALVAEKTNAPQFTFLKAISKEFDIAPQRSAVAQMDALEEFLVQQYQGGKTVLVMVDEAQLFRLGEHGVHPFPAQLRDQHREAVPGGPRRPARASGPHDDPPVQSFPLADRGARGPGALHRGRNQRHDRVSPRILAGRKPLYGEAITRTYEITQGVPRDIVLICGYAYSYALDNNLEAIGPEMIDRAAGNLTMKKDRESIAVA